MGEIFVVPEVVPEIRKHIENYPHIAIGDMVFTCRYFSENDEPACPVAKTDLPKLGLSEQELIESALKRTMEIQPPIIGNITQMIEEMLFGLEHRYLEQEDAMEQMAESSDPMWVLSNKDRWLGSAVILYPRILEKIGERIGKFFVIPSSIHEVIVVKSEGLEDPTFLGSIIKDVNRTEVKPEEVLSNNLFRWDSEKKELVMA